MASAYRHPNMTLSDVLSAHHDKIARLERDVTTLSSMLRVLDDLLAGVRRDLRVAHAAAEAYDPAEGAQLVDQMDPLFT